MTIAGKVHTLVLAISFAAAILMTVVVMQQQYSNARDTLFSQSFELVQRTPQLQIAIYFTDMEELDATLSDILQSSSAILFAIVRSADGSELARRQRNNTPNYNLAPFDQIRGNLSVAEMGLNKQQHELKENGIKAFFETAVGGLAWNLTIPVFSIVNPLRQNIERDEFGRALAESRSAASRHVIGYVHVGISRSKLLLQSLPHMAAIIVVGLVFVLFCYLISRYVTRRITAPFSVIKGMADNIAMGDAVKYQGVENSGEFKEIVALLNSMIGGLHSYKTRMDVDHQLLSMKVEERNSQLSRRNQELNKAVEEITETKNRLRHLAYYDSLTALPNRRLFTEQLDLLLKLSKRNKEMLALVFIDLDNFKRINDSLGHSAGDLLLREAAKRLTHCVRESDLVAHYVEPNSRIDVSRLGGDEFTVVLNQLDSAESAEMVALRLIRALTQPMTIEGHELVITPCIGIALAPGDGDSVEALLRAADKAMYHCKTSGKNKFAFYNDSMEAAGIDRLTLENDLRHAIAQGEMLLHYQPQIDTLKGEVIGAEALMRWQHPELGMIPPFKFITLAEEMGLIGALGEWGLEEACRQMVELQTLGLELPQVSVNVSALQFNQSFIDRVSSVLKDTGLHPKRLQLELTEGIMVDDTEATHRALSRLKELGVGLSIDDFGTGYSSLSYLSRLPLDELKIDRSFVVDINNSENDASLVIAIIAMARSMKLQLIAEGVETADQYHFLRGHGASVIQGYLFSKPVPLNELKLLLTPGRFKAQIEEIGTQ